MLELLFCIIMIPLAIALGSVIIGTFTYGMCTLMSYLEERKYNE